MVSGVCSVICCVVLCGVVRCVQCAVEVYLLFVQVFWEGIFYMCMCVRRQDFPSSRIGGGGTI